MLHKQDLCPEARQTLLGYNAIFKQHGITERYKQSLSAKIEEYMKVGNVTVGISQKIGLYQAAMNSDLPIAVIRTELPNEDHGISWLFSLVRLNLGDGIVEPGSMVAVGHRDQIGFSEQDTQVKEIGMGEFSDDDVSQVAIAEEQLAAIGSGIDTGPYGLDYLI